MSLVETTTSIQGQATYAMMMMLRDRFVACSLCADILEVDIAFLVAVSVLFVLSVIVAGKLLSAFYR